MQNNIIKCDTVNGQLTNWLIYPT